MDTLQFESIALPTTTPQDTEAHHKFKNNDNFKNIGLLIYVANKTIVLYNNCTYIYISNNLLTIYQYTQFDYSFNISLKLLLEREKLILGHDVCNSKITPLL